MSALPWASAAVSVSFMDIRKYLSPSAIEAYELLLAEEEVQRSGDCEIIEREEQGYVFSFGLDPEVSKYSFEGWQGMKEDTVYVMNFPKTGSIVRHI